MDSRSVRLDSLLAALARSLVRDRHRWRIGLVVAGLLSMATAVRLSIRFDAADFRPSSFAAPRQTLRLQDVLQSAARGDPLVILWRLPATSAERVAPHFEALARRLRAIDGVTRVQARLDPAAHTLLTRTLPRHAYAFVPTAALEQISERLQRPALIGTASRAVGSNDPLGLAPYVAQSDGFGALHPRLRVHHGLLSLIPDDGFVVLVDTAIDHRSIPKARKLVASIHAALTEWREVAAFKDAPPPLVAGLLPTYVGTVDTLLSDAGRVSALTTVGVLLLLGLLFRRTPAPFLLLVTVAYAVTVAAAVVAVVLGGINVVAWVFAAIVVGLGVDFGIHVLAQYQISCASGLSKSAAVEAALRRPGPAIVHGCLTSAGALLALQLMPFAVMRDIAWLTGVGVLAAGAASFTVLPTMLLMGSTPRRAPKGARVGRWFADRFDRRRGTTVVGWLLLVIAGGIAMPRLPFEPDPSKALRRAIAEAEHEAQLGRRLGTRLTPMVVVSEGATLAEAVDREGDAVRDLRKMAAPAAIAFIDAVSAWLPDPATQRRNIALIQRQPALLSRARFDADLESVRATSTTAAARLTDDYLSRIRPFLDPDPTPLTLATLQSVGFRDEIERHRLDGPEVPVRLAAFVYLRRSPPRGEKSATRFERVVGRLRLTERPGISVVTPRSQTPALRRGIHRATIATIVIVLLILWLQFRRLRLLALCMVPTLVGLSALAVLMAIFEIDLNLVTLSLAPILIGIGVDDGMHVVHRLQAGQSAPEVLVEAGASLTLTTMTTVAALLGLTIARFDGLAELGWLGSVSLLVCLSASLHLVPALWAATSSAVVDAR